MVSPDGRSFVMQAAVGTAEVSPITITMGNRKPLGSTEFLVIAVRSGVGLVVLEICWVDVRNLGL